MYDFNHVEWVAGGDGINEYVAVYSDGMLGIYGGKFILLSRVGGINMVAVRVYDRRKVSKQYWPDQLYQ